MWLVGANDTGRFVGGGTKIGIRFNYFHVLFLASHRSSFINMHSVILFIC